MLHLIRYIPSVTSHTLLLWHVRDISPVTSHSIHRTRHTTPPVNLIALQAIASHRSPLTLNLAHHMSPATHRQLHVPHVKTSLDKVHTFETPSTFHLSTRFNTFVTYQSLFASLIFHGLQLFKMQYTLAPLTSLATPQTLQPTYPIQIITRQNSITPGKYSIHITL